MRQRQLSSLTTSAIGLGCVGLSQGYGPVDDQQSIRVVGRALELGVMMLDAAMSYGRGHNEQLLARAISGRREQVTLATKFGLRHTLSQTVAIDVPGSPPMGGYLARPADATARRRSVIVGMELFGVSAHVRDVCDRLAAHGYLALAPDLYHRSAPGTELPADDTGRRRGFHLLQQLTRDQAIDDVRASITYLHGQNTTLAGMLGLSVGGHVAYLAAEHLPLPTAVVCYGGWIPTTEITMSNPEPTIAASSKITGRVLILLGGDDPLIPPRHRDLLTDALDTAGIDHELVVYTGVGHGFLCDRRDSYHPEAANDAWNKILRELAH